MDLFVVYVVIKFVCECVVVGEGLILIEIMIYCYGLYIFFGDDLICYCIKEFDGEWEFKDLIVCFCIFLEGKGFWNEEKENVVID